MEPLQMTHKVYFSLPPPALALAGIPKHWELNTFPLKKKKKYTGKGDLESSNISIKDLENRPSVMIKVAKIRLKAA